MVAYPDDGVLDTALEFAYSLKTIEKSEQKEPEEKKKDEGVVEEKEKEGSVSTTDSTASEESSDTLLIGFLIGAGALALIIIVAGVLFCKIRRQGQIKQG